MRDPIRIEECIIDRDEIAAVLRQDGRLVVFLKSGKTINMPDNLSGEELEVIAKLKPE